MPLILSKILVSKRITILFVKNAVMLQMSRYGDVQIVSTGIPSWNDNILITKLKIKSQGKICILTFILSLY